MGSEDETPFASVPEPVTGPYESPSSLTFEGEMYAYGEMARGLARTRTPDDGASRALWTPVLVLGAVIAIVVAVIVLVQVVS